MRQYIKRPFDEIEVGDAVDQPPAGSPHAYQQLQYAATKFIHLIAGYTPPAPP